MAKLSFGEIIVIILIVLVTIFTSAAILNAQEPIIAPPVTDNHDRELQVTIDDIYRLFGLIEQDTNFLDDQMLNVIDGVDNVVDGANNVIARRNA